MPIICEAISVITPLSAVEEKLEGGIQKFLELVPNSSLISDGEIFRVGFMSPLDVQMWVHILESFGMRIIEEVGENVIFHDSAVVDQFQGLTAECDWLETELEGNIRLVKLRGGISTETKLQDGRTLEKIAAGGDFKFTPNEDVNWENLYTEENEIENGLFQHIDENTGEARFVSSPFIAFDSTSKKSKKPKGFLGALKTFFSR